MTAVAFGPGDKSLVSGSRDNVVKHWDVSNGAKLAEFRCTSFGANCLSLTDKRLVACFNDCTAVVWSVESGEVKMVNTAHGGTLSRSENCAASGKCGDILKRFPRTC